MKTQFQKRKEAEKRAEVYSCLTKAEKITKAKKARGQSKKQLARLAK